MYKSAVGLAFMLLTALVLAGERAEGLNEELVATAFQLMADKVRPTLPQMVDTETLWYDMTAGPGPRANYFYCIVYHPAEQADRPLLASRIEPMLRQGICANSNMKLALEHGAVYSYTYISNDEVELVKLEFDRHSCNI